MNSIPSPYRRVPPAGWKKITLGLIRRHPLSGKEIVDVSLKVWEDIFKSGIGSKPFRIGVDLFPRPQILAFFLHELIPLELAQRHPGKWRREEEKGDKDMVYVPDDRRSVEIKTSSSKTRIFGNRSYAQKSKGGGKIKSGYCLAINFEKCTSKAGRLPRILRIRFGWLDATDWRGQDAPSGQQANLPPEVEAGKLAELFPKCEL
jgi:hypothetical protein